MIHIKRFSCSGLTFTLLIALIFTLINIPFIAKSWQIIAPDTLRNTTFALSIPLVLFCGWLAIFSVIALPGIRKPLLVILMIGCAVANYFTCTYGVMIDQNMIMNVFETNRQEAFALVTPQFILWLVLSGILPALVLASIRIKSGQFWYSVSFRVTCTLGSLLVVIALAAIFYKDYASLFRNNKRIVKIVTPPNYINALIRYSQIRWLEKGQPLVRLGEDAEKGPVILTQPKKTVVILVVGEASRAQNYSLGDYERETNPKLKQQDVIWYQDATSCGTETAVSIPCMFSGMSRKNYDASLARRSEGLLDVMNHAGINLLWRENDGGCKGVCNRIPHTDMTLWNLNSLCKNTICFDDVNLYRIDEILDGIQRDSVIVLHLIGSHGPAYYQRYPLAFRRFTPTCDTNEIQNCDRQSLINTYDNTILYTDDVLSRTIDALKRQAGRLNTALVYLSDHGESLGESGIYLHGTPWLFAPKEQSSIPFLFWLSPEYRSSYEIDRDCLTTQAKTRSVSQDNLFSTMLGMLNVQTSVYQKSDDLLASCRSSTGELN